MLGCTAPQRLTTELHGLSQKTEVRKTHLSSPREDERALLHPAHLFLKTIINNSTLIIIRRKPWLSNFHQRNENRSKQGSTNECMIE